MGNSLVGSTCSGKPRILVVGGVAGGASCAARARRLSEDAELCYAPQFGAAKDPVNVAGMIAANALRGDAPVAHWADVGRVPATILDVREPHEYGMGHVDDAINIPLGELRDRMGELPSDADILTYCAVGQRSYYASRALRQYGYNARNVSGGMRTYEAYRRV